MAAAITDKCETCGNKLVDGYNGLYQYCKLHPTFIVYNHDKWTQYVTEEREKEYKALKKLGYNEER